VDEKTINNKLKSVGGRLRKIRMDKGWTLEETEDHGWHDWKYLQKIESGRNTTISTLIKLADLYSIKLFDLFKNL